MEDLVTRLLHDLQARVQGPMHLRLLTQPLLALIFGVRAGLSLAETGGTMPARQELVLQSLADVGRMFLVGLVLDVIFQLWVLRFVYIGEALLAGLLLVALPYSLVREFVFRVRRRSSPH